MFNLKFISAINISLAIDPRRKNKHKTKKMSAGLCEILETAALNPQRVGSYLTDLAHGLDFGVLDPAKVAREDCFSDFLRYLYNFTGDDRGLDRIFVDHFPGIYFGRAKYHEDVDDADDDDEYEFKDDDDGLVGRAPSPAHVANPIVLQESKLPPELTHLIGQFNNTCETITEEGKYCGMGSESPFIYKIADPNYRDGSTFVDCQSECTGDLCINWLTSLFTNLPTVVDIQRAPSGAVVSEWSLPVPISYCKFSIQGTKWNIFLPTPRTQLAIFEQSGVSKQSTVDPAFLRAGCRILNSSRANVLEVELGLGPLDPSDILTQGVLQTFSQFDWKDGIVAHFPEFPDLPAGGNYLSDFIGWKVKYNSNFGSSGGAMFTLNISLPIRDLKARQANLDAINEQEMTRRRVAEAVNATQNGIRNVLQIMANASEEDRELIAEMIKSKFPQLVQSN